MSVTSVSASSLPTWTVWPSCHRNSDVRKNGFVAFISARKAVFQKFIFNGKSLQLLIHFENNVYAKVSDVGLNANLSPISLSPDFVTQNTSGLKPAK